MSILLSEEIREEYRKSRIFIEPYNPGQLGPNSYDVTLCDTLKIYNLDQGEVLDSKKQNAVKSIKIPSDGLILKPNTLYLGSTVEAIGSDHYIPRYASRSSISRLGIQTNISGGLGDIGFKRKWTFEIVVVHPIRIYPGMKIGQISFQTVNRNYNLEKNLYQGKYKDQQEPEESKSYMDFLPEAQKQRKIITKTIKKAMSNF
jgi:dCTP deaminase